MREQLLDRMIRIYGFEHEIVIEFAKMCEEWLPTENNDKALETLVKCHEENPVGFDEDEDFQGLTNPSRCAIMIIENEREVNKMKTVIIEYAMIDPVTLINKIEKAFPGAMAIYTDINEDYFELSVWGCNDLEMLEDVLAEYIQKGEKKTIDN